MAKSSAERSRAYRVRQQAFVTFVTDKMLELQEEITSLRTEVGTVRHATAIPIKNLPTGDEDSHKEVRKKKNTPSLRSGVTRVRGTRLPPDWAPSADLENYARNLGVDPDLVAESMRNWAHSKGIIRVSWPATYRTICQREAKDQKGRVNGRVNGFKPSPMNNWAKGMFDAIRELQEEEDRRAGAGSDVALLDSRGRSRTS